MQKKKWDKLGNLALIALLIIILFTPLGTTIKVYVNRLIAFSPGVESPEEQEKLNNYEWSLVGLEGTKQEFHDLKGEVILINLWATWCPPCIAEMPALQNLYNEFGDKVQFLFVANDEREKVSRFMNDNSYDLPVYFSRTEIPGQLYSRSIPATYLVDRKGNIVIEKTGSAKWDSESVKHLLDSLVNQR
ncbi:TlpA family protein disulfide reductase [Robertkochia aurantiaca]|uniref:TlpA family protein disulfide reductase n=1 Tax=Robertkochia aurantiaca TaxID=2873700 RepID=UPI001CCDC863|nr:TlpA disulfide reductase family protein [Robertkochia sp. 3YJGBD-33]